MATGQDLLSTWETSDGKSIHGNNRDHDESTGNGPFPDNLNPLGYVPMISA